MIDASKPGRFIHFLPGGGLGDVFREGYFFNAIGVLKRWKLAHPTSHLKVLLMTHNPATQDLLAGQTWIDEVTSVRFPVEKTWEWQSVYDYYASEFDGFEEIRMSYYDHRTLYDSNKNRLRKRLVPVRNIDPIGTSWCLELSADEWDHVHELAGRVVFHPFAGSSDRALSTYPELLNAVHTALTETGLNYLTVGANYARPAYKEIPAHDVEDGVTLAPRVLAEVLRRSPAVIGTESSVYYIASMLGTPTCLVYPNGTAYERLTRGDHVWDWFYNLMDSRSKALNFAKVVEGAPKIAEWAQRLASTPVAV